MKKYIPGLLTILLIVLAFGSSAFTTKSSQKVTCPELKWFLYDSGPVWNPESYVVDENQTGFGCDGSGTICRILVPFTEIGGGDFVANLDGITLPGERSGNGVSEVSVRLVEE